ncbi:MAG: TIGR03790 family protein, partial [Terrimicrobiaceae bacterium]
MRSKRLLLLVLAVVLSGGAGLGAPSPEARATVVVFNTADPASVALAKYYAGRREIPTDQLVGLSCPQTEEISRQEFVTTIANPLRDTFVRKGWWRVEGGRVTQTKVRFVALIRGVPLKVRSEGEAVQPRTDQPESVGKRDEASVDSELACLGLGSVPTAGLIPNSYFRRFTPVLEAIADPGLLLVCRLDAPTDITVRAMIDDAIMAERDGLWGWAYVDTRSIKDAGYIEGDEWLKTAAQSMREKGIPVLWDKAPETLPAGYPVTDAAVYLGWYADTINGPFAAPDFRFRPGAIAVHIHSFSAATLRNPA